MTLTFGYDVVGNPTPVKDSKGGAATLAFDSLIRQIGEELGGTGVTGVNRPAGTPAGDMGRTGHRITLSKNVWNCSRGNGSKRLEACCLMQIYPAFVFTGWMVFGVVVDTTTPTTIN